MDTCPAEIHCYIFSLSCLDDGVTGLSLSQVSRYVRTVSAPYRWQTLAISGAKQASAFAALLSGLPETLPIRHLFLSDRTRDNASEEWTAKIGTTLNSWGDDDPEETAQWEALYHSALQWRTAQRQILEYAAPTLQALTFLSFDVSNSSLWIGDMLTVQFPTLTELCIRSPLIVFPKHYRDAVKPQNIASPSHQMPILRRFHLARFQDLDVTRTLIRTTTPHITHLRISGIERDFELGTALHAELAELGIVPPVLAPLPFDWDSQGTDILACDVHERETLLPSTIQSIIVQPLELPPQHVCRCCSGYRQTFKLIHVLKEMGRESDRKQFAVLPGLERKGYSYQDAYSDWVTRVEGGEGCWAT